MWLGNSAGKPCGEAKTSSPFSEHTRFFKGCETLSYVKCLVCGNKFQQVNGSHLKKHGLTIAQYRQLYPEASLMAPKIIEKISKNLWGVRKWKPYKCECKLCGQLFEKRCGNSFYCEECREKVNRRNRRRSQRLYNIKRRNSGKGRKFQLGTFGKKYLQIVDGRVKGAVLLEKRISINSLGFGNGPKQHVCSVCGASSLIIIHNHQGFCSECGARLIVAKEDDNYTIPEELCCSKCGLVYDLT